MTNKATNREIEEGSPMFVVSDTINDRGSSRWTTNTLIVAAGFLTLTNAPVAGAWLDELPHWQIIECLRPGVQAWERMTAGFASSHAWVRGQWRRAHNLRFGTEQPGESGANDAP